MNKFKRIIIFEIIFFAALLAADLLSKHFIMKFLNENTVGYYVVIDKVLALRYSLNDGAGFSMFSGKIAFLITFTSVALVLVTGLLVYFHYRRDTEKRGGLLLSASLIMVLAGGLGNLIDRISFGYVRDFIEYKFVETLFDRTFAICNIADVELTVGMVLLIVYILFFYQDKKKVLQPAASPEEAKAVSEYDDMNISEALKMYDDKRRDALICCGKADSDGDNRLGSSLEDNKLCADNEAHTDEESGIQNTEKAAEPINTDSDIEASESIAPLKVEAVAVSAPAEAEVSEEQLTDKSTAKPKRTAVKK